MQEKIEYAFKILRADQNVPKKFLRHLTGTDGLYETRAPKKEIEMALKLKKENFNSKKKTK